MAPTCTVPACGQPAVLQWQRHGTADEATTDAERLDAARQAIVDQQRQQAETYLAQCQAQLFLFQQAAAAGGDVNPDVLARAVAAVPDAQAALDAIVDPVPTADQPVVIAVFGCATHEITPDRSVVVHPATCCQSGPCTCVLP